MCSPRCCATSTVRLSVRPSIDLLVSNSAVLISGKLGRIERDVDDGADDLDDAAHRVGGVVGGSHGR